MIMEKVIDLADIDLFCSICDMKPSVFARGAFNDPRAMWDFTRGVSKMGPKRRQRALQFMHEELERRRMIVDQLASLEFMR